MRRDERTLRCIEACVNLAYEPKTICIVSDEPLVGIERAGVTCIATRAGTLTSPAFKRDIARQRFPNADVYANLDDDAYPPAQWLNEAARVLNEHPNASGAGGPGLDPPDMIFWERVSSAVLQARAGSGPLRFRFWPDPARDCDDFPSHNLFIRTTSLNSVGGWSTNWNGGEDTLLCARLAALSGPIRYDPTLAAYHYRRTFIPDHLRQMFNFGRSRGCFIRSGERRSLRLSFAGPVACVAATVALVFSPLFGVPWLAAGLAIAAIYCGLALFGHPGRLDWRIRLLLPVALFAHNAAYAAGMAFGLATGRRKVRRDPATESAEQTASA
jgi:hypothetical protein